MSHRAEEKLAAMSDLELGRLLRRSRLFRRGDKTAKSRHLQRWSAAEEQLLGRWTDAKVAKFLGRGIWAVIRRRLSLGLRKWPHRKWTKREDALLALAVKDRKTKSFTRNLAKKLGRSHLAVRQRLRARFGTIRSFRPWTPREKSLLGTKLDREIAALIGRSKSAVSAHRKFWGIKPAVIHRRFTRQEDQLLGTASDRVLARRLGRSKEAICSRRHYLGIANPCPRFWLPEQEKLLGTKPDKEIAAVVGHSANATTLRRLKLGRPAADAQYQPWTERDNALLGTKPDREIARRLGRTPGAVRTRRFQRRIPILRPNRAKDWTADEKRLLGTRPDRELAGLFHRSPVSIMLKRLKLGIPCFKPKRKK